MNGTKIPRYLVVVLMLISSVAIVMVSMFYAQYRLLGDELTQASATEHSRFVQETLESRACARLDSIADDIIASIDAGVAAGAEAILDHAVTTDETLMGLRFSSNVTGAAEVALMPGVAPADSPGWRDNQLVLT